MKTFNPVMEISHRHHYCISKTNQRGEVLLKSRRYLLMLIWDSMIFPSRGAAVSNHTTVLSLSFCSVIQKTPTSVLYQKVTTVFKFLFLNLTDS